VYKAFLHLQKLLMMIQRTLYTTVVQREEDSVAISYIFRTARHAHGSRNKTR